MRILIVHEVSYRKKVVYEFQDLPERLKARGHDVSVIDFDADEPAPHRIERISRTGLAEIALESTPSGNIPIAKYWLARHSYRCLLERKLKRQEIDVVLLYSVFVNGTNTVDLCRAYGVPVVYRVLDVYHRLRRNPFMTLPLYLGERRIYRTADVICLANDKMRDYVRSMVPSRFHPRFETIEHGVDTRHFRPRERDPAVRRRLGLTDDARVMLFLGTTYAFSRLDRLLESFDRLREQCPAAALLVVGGGELDAKLQDMIRERNLGDRVVLTGVQQYADLPPLMAAADVGLLPFEINDITRDIVPIKLVQYLASGLPTLSAPLPELVRLFPSDRSGVVYAELREPEGYFRQLAALLCNDARRAELASRAVRFIEQGFSIDTRIDKLETLFEELVRRKVAVGAP
jgi:glycosyltransferase involved in cell wall biosynthesis